MSSTPKHNPTSEVADRLAPFGSTVFARISRLANEFGAVNLGQGFPDFDGPDHLIRGAMDALEAGPNQYAPTIGLEPLRTAVADRFRARYGLAVDPDAEVTVTAGCTEALAASFMGLVNPGDEVVLFEPFYDSYRACVAMAGGTPRFVPLRWPDFRFDEADLRAAFSDRTRLVLVNTPHNPTGRVFDTEELTLIAELCRRHDALALTDEVYDDLVYEGTHVPMATIPGMRDRTLTLSSIGKSFSVTGWKVGWAIGPRALTAAVRSAHQFLVFAVPPALQIGAAIGLREPGTYLDDQRDAMRARRDLLAAALGDLGFAVAPAASGYFLMADHSAFGDLSDEAFCAKLIEEVGVAAIPPSSFYSHPELGRSLTRFAFCKREATIEEAIRRLGRLRAG